MSLIGSAMVGIIVGLTAGLMGFIENKHEEGKIGNTTFFHLLTCILILIPWFLIGLGIIAQYNFLSNFRLSEISFYIVILFSISNYIRCLRVSFFETEVFKNSSQWIIFFIYAILLALSNFYYGYINPGVVGNTLENSLVLVLGFYHFNKSNISKKNTFISVLLGTIISPFMGLIAIGLFYYKVRRWMIIGILALIGIILFILLVLYGPA